MILVVGASGHLGHLVAEGLIGREERVRILDRGSGASADLVVAGAEVAAGDLKDPDSLASACSGVDAVVTTANSAARGGADDVESVDRRGNIALIDAAVEAGVTRFVFTSLLGASAHSPAPFVRAKGEAESICEPRASPGPSCSPTSSWTCGSPRCWAPPSPDGP